MDPVVVESAQKLAEAVQTVMNPTVDHRKRLEAHQLCEDFKESSPICAQCGLLLTNKDQPAIVRNFGLQLLEHCIKYRWNSMNQEEKMFIKENTMTLLAFGTGNILTEESHIKNVLSRIVVEMIKREWPQQWPTLLSELNQLCEMGATQTELVLLILLRLAEDVVTFQSVQIQRRRDILQTLTGSMNELFAFMMKTLESNTTMYQQLKAYPDGPQAQECQIHCKVSQAVLVTLTGYVDWVSWQYIFENNGLLLQMLCLLLKDEHLQFYAAECLLLIVNRKGSKLEERKPLLALFSEDAMSTILEAAQSALHASLNEYYYHFLKKLCQVLTGIGSQLSALWGSSDDIGCPPNFEKYLEAILVLTQHPSKMLGSYTYTLLASFLRHENISQDPVLLAIIPRILEIASSTLIKVGFPSHQNHPSCDYSRLDFDSDEDFNVFFSRYRAEVAETLRCATMLCPSVTFEFAARWLGELLRKPLTLGGSSDTGHCNLSSPSFLEWDAMVVFLESVMARLMISDKSVPPMEQGMTLLKQVLSFETQDPLILSCVLSCISALFTFITYAPETLSTVLDKIFSTVVFNVTGQTKATRSRAVKNVRRHACSSLVKICKQYPALLLPGFDQLYALIKQIGANPDELSQLEKCTLIESLVLISNEMKNFQKQSEFIGEILIPVKTMWLSEEFNSAFWSTAKFMTYVGLDQAPVEPSSADICGINRSHIIYCINTILAVMKRSKWPADFEACKRGGFISSTSDLGTSIFCNPSTTHISVLLNNVLALLRVFNELWLPEKLGKRHPEFAKAYDLQELEKLVLLGIQPPCIDNTDAPASKQPLERMQSFLTTAYDNCCHILGNAGQCLGYEFYNDPSLAAVFLKTVFTNLEHIPDYRIRPIIRVFLKPFIQHCPKECYEKALLPLVNFMGSYMLQRLSEKWTVMNQRTELSNDDDDENPESQEVVDDSLTRQLTREYIELIGSMFHNHRRHESTPTEDIPMEDSENATHHTKDDSVSELGQLILRSEKSIWPDLILCVFQGLSWNDTTTCNKCIGLCWPMVKQLIAYQLLPSDAACHLFTKVLCGLMQHGQHEGCQSLLLGLGLQMYETLRPVFPDMQNTLSEIPSINPKSVKEFDDKLFQPSSAKPIPEKKKKESFKKLVSSIIGQSLSQQYKREVHIRNLPRIFKPRKKTTDMLETENKDVGLCQLFQPTDNV